MKTCSTAPHLFRYNSGVDTTLFILITDIIGTVAFAVSGAIAGIRKEMDIFGINILAIVTATGGGIIRDLIIGKMPPTAFIDPFFVLLAAITANVVFLFVYMTKKTGKKIPDKARNIYDQIFFWCDSAGLAAFTVDGVHAGLTLSGSIAANAFLVVFLGVLTGVGGGVIRDVLSLEMPMIFVKHVYACASILGAIVMFVICGASGSVTSGILAGFFVTLVIRYLAAHFGWNLPKIKN